MRPDRSISYLLAAGLLLAAGSACALVQGDVAPRPALSTSDSKPFDWPALRGKVVLVDFWASWGGPCRLAFPAYDAMAQRHAEAGFVVLGVNVDEQRADAERFLRAVPVAFTVVFDEGGKAPSAYGVKAMPSSYLVGRDGRIRLVHMGFKPSDAEKIEAEVIAALKEGAP
jgi:thiol-disulfide isomerase/thioredoxin